MSFSNYKSITFRAASGSSLIDGGESGRYATNLIETTVNGQKDFIFEVYRCPKLGTCSEDNATHVGTRNSIGALVLNNSANDTERQYYNKLNRQTKSQANSIVPSGLTASEQTTYNLKAGNGSQALINSTTSDGVTIGDSIGTQVGNLLGDITTQDGNSTTQFDLTNTTIDVSIGGRRFRKQYGHFSYPEDLRTNKQDRVRFTQKYTEGTKIDATITSGQRTFQRKVKKVRGSVTLPVVTGIEDTSAVDWNDGKLNPIQALAGASALGIFQQVRQSGDIADAFRTAAGSLNRARMDMQGQVGGDLQSAINVYLAQQAVGAQGLLSRTTGAILNPNLELLFGGPKLRSFGFSFKLSARDAKEADQIRKIIRFFKQGMSVKTSSSNVFLKAPNIFDIQYQTFNTDGTEIVHPSINIIKTCALTSCNVQYTPDGTYMTYDDPYRTLTAYQLTMQFSELDPIYDSDYSELDKDKDQVIGY
jgi:hypothetical protein